MKKGLILVAVLILIAGSIYYLESTRIKIPTSVSKGETVEVKEGKYPKAPELTGIVGYLNGAYEGMQISDFRGKVVLIDFWTYTCINCIRTLPFLKEWDSKYKDKGLVIIGVHTPEFEFEKERENVENAIKKYELKYFVVQDNNYATWRAFNNRFWPRKYLIDKDGFIRFDHIGEGAYEETEKMIQSLLTEAGASVEENMTRLPDLTPRVALTPELYAGYLFAIPRGQNVGNKEGLQLNEVIDYALPASLTRNVIYLEGKWQSREDDLLSHGKSSIVLDFTANSVNIVVGSGSENVEMEVFINDQYVSEEQAGDDVVLEDGKAIVKINGPRLYNVIDGDYGSYRLKLTVDSETFNFNAFTFG